MHIIDSDMDCLPFGVVADLLFTGKIAVCCKRIARNSQLQSHGISLFYLAPLGKEDVELYRFRFRSGITVNDADIGRVCLVGKDRGRQGREKRDSPDKAQKKCSNHKTSRS